MSFLTRLWGGQSRAVAPSVDVNARGLTPPKNSEQGLFAPEGGSGRDLHALQLIAVQACVRLLADSIASLPLSAYRRSEGTRVHVDTPLLVDPAQRLTDFEWKFQIVSSLALRGNSYQVVTARDSREFATALEPIHPDQVNVEVHPETGVVTYRVDGERIANHDMVHIKRFVMPGWAQGLSPIGAAAQSVGLTLAAERYGAAYFRDSAHPSAVLTTDQNLDDDQSLRIMKSWVDTHGGRRFPAMLSGGMQYRPIAITPNESQFLQTRQFQRGEIAMLFGIPPHMIGDTAKSTSWGSGIEQQSIGFVTYTLRPWLTCIESALSRLLPRGQFVKFNIDALLRGDQKSRYEAYTQGRMSSWMSVNEIRALEDLPPIKNGDNYIQPLNYGPLGTDPTAGEPAPEQPPKEDDHDEADADH